MNMFIFQQLAMRLGCLTIQKNGGGMTSLVGKMKLHDLDIHILVTMTTRGALKVDLPTEFILLHLIL